MTNPMPLTGAYDPWDDGDGLDCEDDECDCDECLAEYDEYDE